MRDKFTGKGQDRGDDSRLSSVHIMKLAQKLFNTGAEAVNITRDELRALVELNPREALNVMVENLIKGTDQLQTILVREAQRYLNAIDLRDEFGKVLSNYSIEVNATINFVPREKASARKKARRKGGDAAELETEKLKVTFVPKEGEEGNERPTSNAERPTSNDKSKN